LVVVGGRPPLAAPLARHVCVCFWAFDARPALCVPLLSRALLANTSKRQLRLGSGIN
jgi:hypothetical protein